MRKNLIRFCVLFLALGAVLLTAQHAFASETDIITAKADLESALVNAHEGDTILVGDLSLGRFTWDKSVKNITVKSGKETNAVFSNTMIGFLGSVSDADPLTVRFENIDFRGDHAGQPVDPDDADAVASTGIGFLKTMCAATFAQNLDITFSGCTFEGYHYGYGGVFSALYSSGDNAGCELKLTLDNCEFRGNAGKRGGCLYFNGYNENIILNARHCTFGGNAAATGGVIYADNAVLRLTDCVLSENRHLNAAEPENRGGALAIFRSICELDGCVIADNEAKDSGGGIYALISPSRTLVMKNCTVSGNRSADGSGITVTPAPTELDASAAEHLYFCTVVGGLSLTQNAETFGCLFVREGAEACTPCAENGYCRVTDPAALPSARTRAAESLHIGASAEDVIPREAVAKIAGGKFANSFCDLRSGDNYRKETAVTLKEGAGKTRTFTVAYGDRIFADSPERRGFAFSGWQYPNGAAVDPEAVFVGGELPEGTIAADWDFVLSENLYVIFLPLIAVLAVFAAVIFFRKRKSPEQAAPSPTPVPTPEPMIVKAWFTEEEIVGILSSLPKARTLTSRETEVLTEMLEGKKQKEIAHDLGIEITTVKDFYRKIYERLGCANREDLMKHCTEIVRR